MNTSLANKWVLITGASSGFGAAGALAFAEAGARLLLGARRTERLADVAAEATRRGSPAALFHALDVADPASVDAFVAWVRGTLAAAGEGGSLDVLINNAGGAKGLDKLADAHEADWKFMFDTNVLGLLRMTKGCLPLMLDNPGGTILNIGSIAGRTAYEGGSAYCAAKAAELMITRSLRLEVVGTGVRVCTLDPGFAETEFSLVRFKGDTARARKVYEGMIPLTAEDVAETMVWMVSRPAHVCIDELVIKPTDQAAPHKVHRRPVTS